MSEQKNPAPEEAEGAYLYLHADGRAVVCAPSQAAFAEGDAQWVRQYPVEVMSAPAQAEPIKTLETYDPNVTWATTTVRITYQMWNYRLEHDVEVGGNCRGIDVLDSALRIHSDQLFDEQGDEASLTLVDPTNGDTLLCEMDEEDRGIERWLERMCVGLQIVRHERKAP